MLGDLSLGVLEDGMAGDSGAWELWLDAIAGKHPQPD